MQRTGINPEPPGMQGMPEKPKMGRNQIQRSGRTLFPQDCKGIAEPLG
jgi:hypothetical protein